jgi:competence protein ComEA
MLKKLLALMMALFTALAFAAVDVNSADATALDSVKGIGPAIAGKITAERKNGPYKSWDDLITRVPGIGEKSAVKLSEGGLTVGGASYKGAVPKAAEAPKTPAKADAKPAAATTTAAPAATAASAPMSADDKKAAAKKAKEEKAAAAAKAKEEKAAAAAKAKEEKAAAKKAAKDAKEAKPADAKASAPAAKK